MDAAEPTKPKTISGAIKGLFRTAAKAVARVEDEDETEHKTRRGGEREGQFGRMARYLWRRFDVRRSFRLRTAIASRYAPVDPEAYAVATKYLSNTLDMLNRIDSGPGSDYGDSFNAISNPSSPHL
jgi:hypothetical protein